MSVFLSLKNIQNDSFSLFLAIAMILGPGLQQITYKMLSVVLEKDGRTAMYGLTIVSRLGDSENLQVFMKLENLTI